MLGERVEVVVREKAARFGIPMQQPTVERAHRLMRAERRAWGRRFLSRQPERRLVMYY